MTKILASREIIDNSLAKLQTQVEDLKKKGSRPKLQVILVGNNPASLIYVRNKERLCKQIGALFELVELPEDIAREHFLAAVNNANIDPEVNGCFVQLPVPSHLQDIDVTQLINPVKDVDGFHLNSIVNLYKSDTTGFVPCTPKGIVSLLKYYGYSLEGKHIVIIGRSYIVGKPLSLLLDIHNATVTLCHSKTQDLKKYTLSADIVITAVGNPIFLGKEYFRNDKTQILIDVGITKHNGKVVGDIDYCAVKDQVAAITPVPGGVGPLTVFSLMENLIQATKNQLKT